MLLINLRYNSSWWYKHTIDATNNCKYQLNTTRIRIEYLLMLITLNAETDRSGILAKSYALYNFRALL